MQGSRAPAWDAAGHAPPTAAFCGALHWVRALACSCSSSLISPALPKTLFCNGHPQARCELLWLGTTLCLVPIAVVLLVLIINLRLYKKQEWASWDQSSHALFLLPAFLL